MCSFYQKLYLNLMLILYEDMSLRKNISEDMKFYSVGSFIVIVDAMYVFSLIFILFGGKTAPFVFKEYWFAFAAVGISKIIIDENFFLKGLQEWEKKKKSIDHIGIYERWRRKWKLMLILYFSMGCLLMVSSIFAAVVMKR